MAASGVEDSPRAKRGCRWRSRRSTWWPCLWRMRARIDPAKPEPTMAMFMRPPKDPKDCKDCKDDKDLVGAALCGRPGGGEFADSCQPPAHGCPRGPPPHSPPANPAIPHAPQAAPPD